MRARAPVSAPTSGSGGVRLAGGDRLDTDRATPEGRYGADDRHASVAAHAQLVGEAVRARREALPRRRRERVRQQSSSPASSSGVSASSDPPLRTACRRPSGGARRGSAPASPPTPRRPRRIPRRPRPAPPARRRGRQVAAAPDEDALQARIQKGADHGAPIRKPETCGGDRVTTAVEGGSRGSSAGATGDAGAGRSLQVLICRRLRGRRRCSCTTTSPARSAGEVDGGRRRREHSIDAPPPHRRRRPFARGSASRSGRCGGDRRGSRWGRRLRRRHRDERGVAAPTEIQLVSVTIGARTPTRRRRARARATARSAPRALQRGPPVRQEGGRQGRHGQERLRPAKRQDPLRERHREPPGGTLHFQGVAKVRDGVFAIPVTRGTGVLRERRGSC